jgi:hypothetical protein
MFPGNNRQVRRYVVMGTSAAAVAALALAQGGAASLGSLGNFFFGPKLVRAEVITSDGGVLHDYRVDHGKIRLVSPTSLTLFEKDGTTVAVPIAPNATVTLGNVPTPLKKLRKGFMATTVRDGTAAAYMVVATRR